jgi:CRP/FNR family transcriptional regulator
VALSRHFLLMLHRDPVDIEVCRLPFADLRQLSREIPVLGHNLSCMMSREIARGIGVMLLLGSLRADQRLATFLLILSHRFLVRGYSPSRLVLRMTRSEIGSYLGLKPETVSRMFTRFQRTGIPAL